MLFACWVFHKWLEASLEAKMSFNKQTLPNTITQVQKNALIKHSQLQEVSNAIHCMMMSPPEVQFHGYNGSYLSP